MHRYRQQIRGYRGDTELKEGKTSKGHQSCGDDGNQIFDGERHVVYTDFELQCCIPETHILL